MQRLSSVAAEASADDLDGWQTEAAAKVSAFVITSGLGEAGKLIARTAASQFPVAKVFVQVVTHAEEGKVRAVIEVAHTHKPSIILYSLYIPDIKDLVVSLAQQHGLPCVDLFGPICDAISTISGVRPIQTPHAFQEVEEERALLSEAMKFAIAHDDGARDEDWGEADALILGISRAGKSPLAMFLATLGYKVANYPVCPGIPLPANLSLIDIQRVFAITLDPEVLVKRRECRAKQLNGSRPCESLTKYACASRVYEEVEQAQQMYKKMRVTTIDTTDRPLPAVAAKVLQLLSYRFCRDEDESPWSPKKERRPSSYTLLYQPQDAPRSPIPAPAGKMVTLCLATSGVGFSGTRVLAGVRGLFPNVVIRTEVLPHVQHSTIESLADTVSLMANPIVALTVVIDDVRHRLLEKLEAMDIPCVDLLGPFQDVLAAQLGMRPSEDAALYMHRDAVYYQIVEAVEFAVQHDGGAKRVDWPRADCVVLGGASMGKSALAVFLGTMGWAAANCRVNPDDESLPKELAGVHPQRVFGLTSKTDPGDPASRPYCDGFCGRSAPSPTERLLQSAGVTVIDITFMPTESVAQLVIRHLTERFGDRVSHCRPGPTW